MPVFSISFFVSSAWVCLLKLLGRRGGSVYSLFAGK
ncbi:hypothetical protein EVA_18948 [gut metagenome]|uniref:Uncharacterized protein n=1 Tax=gut metagenome TaxID=749906 RepID=J9FEU6_9ZZZZ